MELNTRRLVRRKSAVQLDGSIRDIGGMIGDVLRSSVDVAGRAMNTIATRGGADSLVTLSDEPAPQPVNPMVWYGLGAAGILLVAGIAAKKRRKR